MSRRNRPGRPRTQPRDVEVDAVSHDGEGRAGPMAVEVVPIASLSPNPANVRLHDSRSIDGIAGSLRRFKQQKPLVVDQDGVVRAGNGTLAAAKQLGWTEIAVVRTTLTGAELVGYEIADNHLPEFSTWDKSGLAATLRALQDEDFDLDAVGFTDAEVDALLGNEGGEVVEDPQAEWQGMPEFEHEDLTSQFQVIVHFANEADMRSFEELVGQKIPTNTRSIWHPKAERQTVKGSGYVSDEP